MRACQSVSLSVVVALSLGACTKADTASTTPPTAEPAHHETGHEPGTHKHNFKGSVDAFHERMAPLWHAPAGDARRADTCAAVDALIDDAEAIRTEAAPEGVSDADAWTEAAADLSTAAQALKTTCANAPADFDARFTSLHEAFHALVKLAGHG